MVNEPDMQKVMKIIFSEWGLPVRIKFDNGRPFGNPFRDSIPLLALWLVGIGIQVIFNRPARPTDNAKVERMQAVTKNWSVPKNCQSVEELQAKLTYNCHLQRACYPLKRKEQKTRIQIFPKLLVLQRTYEETKFDMQAVWQYLAQGVWRRKVSKKGQIKFYGRRWQVGANLHGQVVDIVLDPTTQLWKVSSKNGDLQKEFAFITEQELRELKAS